jgi:hypothetical protein
VPQSRNRSALAPNTVGIVDGFTHPMDILAQIPWETRWPAEGGLDRLIERLEQEPHEELVDHGGDDDRQRDPGCRRSVTGTGSKSPQKTQRVADLEFLRRLFNWAGSVQGPDRRPICAVQPLKSYEIPYTPNPKRPVARYDRWLLIREHADAVDAQQLFGGF